MIRIAKFIVRQFSIIIWWLCWLLFVAALIHQHGFSWSIAFADSTLMTTGSIMIAFATGMALKYYQLGMNSKIYRVIWNMVLTALMLWLTGLLLKYWFNDVPDYAGFIDQSFGIRFGFVFLMNAFLNMIEVLHCYVGEQKVNQQIKSDADKLVREAELSGLRLQMQPHFLFNSLNSINALIGSNASEARKMVQLLSEFLRGTLKKDDRNFVSLKEELNHLSLYLDIEKVRFGSRLDTVIEINDECLQQNVPPLILQPVVENAIKFGLYDTTGQVTISIIASCQQGILIVTVSNPYDPATASAQRGTGFGLDAVQRRLFLLFARNDLLKTSAANNIFSTTISIPQS
jgi:sensor histidine kinase YesM